MISDFSKYPKTKKFLEEHPEMTLDNLLIWTEEQLEKIEGENRNESKNDKSISR